MVSNCKNGVMKTEKPYILFEDHLIDELKNLEDAQLFLRVSLEEYARDVELEVLLECLQYVSIAQKSRSFIGESTQGDQDKELKVYRDAMRTFVESFDFSFTALSLDQLPA